METALLYPDCDFSIWFRSVDEETTTEDPIEGHTTGMVIVLLLSSCVISVSFSSGTIPEWINGCFYQNGPGLLDVTGKRVAHLFDAFALIQKYEKTSVGRFDCIEPRFSCWTDSQFRRVMLLIRIEFFNPTPIDNRIWRVNRVTPSTAQANRTERLVGREKNRNRNRRRVGYYLGKHFVFQLRWQMRHDALPT